MQFVFVGRSVMVGVELLTGDVLIEEIIKQITDINTLLNMGVGSYDLSCICVFN